MNAEQARAVDIGIRAINGATFSAKNKNEAKHLIYARRTLERMLSEGFRPCEKCGRLPTPFAMLVESDGWCAVCHCPRQAAYGKSLEALREAWNEGEGSP